MGCEGVDFRAQRGPRGWLGSTLRPEMGYVQVETAGRCRWLETTPGVWRAKQSGPLGRPGPGPALPLAVDALWYSGGMRAMGTGSVPADPSCTRHRSLGGGGVGVTPKTDFSTSINDRQICATGMSCDAVQAGTLPPWLTWGCSPTCSTLHQGGNSGRGGSSVPGPAQLSALRCLRSPHASLGRHGSLSRHTP